MRSLTPWRRRRRARPRPNLVAANPLCTWLGEYRAASAAEGGAPETLRTQSQAILRFIRWADTRGIRQIGSITRAVLQQYQQALHGYRKRDGGGLCIGSQLVLLAALKAWLKWLVRQNQLLSNPADWLRLPRLPARLPANILSATKIERLFALADTRATLGIRDRAILETLYSCGIRRAELVGVAIADVDFDEGTLMIRSGKGRRDRLVPLGASAVDWLSCYLATARPRLSTGETGDSLLIDELGRALTPRYLGDLVRRYFQHAGIAGRGACHVFRHSMATHMLDNGADIRHIQAILGHARLETTQIYTRVSIRKLKEVHAATHPASKLRRPQS